MNKHRSSLRRCTVFMAALVLSAAALRAEDEVPPTARIVAAPAAPLKATDQVGPIVLSKMPVQQVIDLIQTYSGRVIIPAAGLPKPTLSFKSTGELRRDEAILALETLLNLNGVMLVKHGDKFIQAVPHADIMRRGPVMLDGDETGGQAEQQVYGRIFELKHMDSRTMFYQVRNLLSPGGVSTILDLSWRDALLIFDTAHNLESLGNVIDMLDRPPEKRAEVFILPVSNSSVYSVYYALLHAQRNHANAALYKARFHLDSSANRLVAVAPPESKAYIEELVETLDKEIAPLTTSRIFKIRKGNVRTVYSILYGIIRHQQTWFSKQGFRSPETFRLTQELAEEPAAAPAGAEVPTSGTEAGLPPVDVVVSDLAGAAAELQFSPYMGVWIDYQNDALVAYGTPADMTRAAVLIEQLDQESAPYTSSEIIPLKHAFAPGIGGLLNHMVHMQRSMFARQGQASGEAREGQSASEGTPADAFEFSPYMYIWAERASNAVLVYGTRDDIERIRAIIAKLDVEQAPVTRSKAVEIRHTQATSCASLISRIITLQRYAYAREGIYTGDTRDNAGTTPAEGSGMETGFEFTPYALVTADRTSNALFIYGTERDIQRVEELLLDLDRETAPITKSKVYYLKHADAYSLSRMVTQVIYSQRRTFQQLGLRSGEEDAETNPAMEAEIAMGFEFSDFATVVADRRSNSILFYGTDSDIARVDNMIEETDIKVDPITSSRVFALKHAEANNLARMLQTIVSSQRRAMQSVESAGEKVRNSPSGKDYPGQTGVEGDPVMQFSAFLSIVPDARNNALIVYGTHSDVEHVAALVEKTDVEVAPMTRSEVFFLENARANTLASILSRMIRGQQSAMRVVQSRFLAVQNQGRNDEDEALAPMLYDSSQSMQFSPYVSVVANDRNNSLLVYGTDSDISQLADIVEQNDVAIAPKTQSRIFYIRHADANEVVQTINPLITSQQRVREREATLRRIFRRNQTLGQGEDPELGGQPEMLGGSDEIGPDPMDAMSEATGVDFDEDLQFSPYVTLSADDRSNSIIVYGTPFDLEQVENLILQIDRVLPQVQIEVVIAEVIIKKGQVTGLDSFGISYDNPFPFQVDSGANGGVIGRGGVLGSAPSLEAGGSSAAEIGMSFDPFSIQSVFRVAQEDSNVRVLSAPTITTSHNRPASINVGEARPIITSSTSTLNNNNTTRSTVEYRDIGIELKVRPLVSDQGFIQMEIEQVVETVIDTQTIDNNEQPIIGTRRANSFVSVRDSQIIVMGGLQSEATIVSEGKVWLLGDIPLIGRLFRPKKRTSTVRELIIFIRPVLVTDMTREELIARQEENPGTVTKDVVSFYETGHFPGQLPDENPPGETATNTTAVVEEVNNAD